MGARAAQTCPVKPLNRDELGPYTTARIHNQRATSSFAVIECCSKHKDRKSYRLGTTWGWVNDDRILAVEQRWIEMLEETCPHTLQKTTIPSSWCKSPEETGTTRNKDIIIVGENREKNHTHAQFTREVKMRSHHAELP